MRSSTYKIRVVESLPELALAIGPTKVIEAYETGQLQPMTDPVEKAMGMDACDIDVEFHEGYLFDALNSIWEERMVTPPALPTDLDNTLWYSILETIQEHDVCMCIFLLMDACSPHHTR